MTKKQRVKSENRSFWLSAKKFFKALVSIGLLFKFIRLAYMEWLYAIHLRVRGLHDSTYQRIKWYKGWSDTRYSSFVHKSILFAFVLSFAIFGPFNNFFFNRPQKALAGSHSVTWTSNGDFYKNKSTVCGDTTRSGTVISGDVYSDATCAAEASDQSVSLPYNPVVTATVAVGTQPNGVATNSSTNMIYVTNTGSNNVSVIDGSTNTVTATVDVGIQPYGIAANPSTNMIYVANNNSGTVSVIDGATNTVTATVAVGSNPAGIATNSTTNKIYSANESSSTVSVIDGATNTVTATVAVGSNPWGITVNPATNIIYSANDGSNTISVIDGATDTVTNTISLGSSTPYGITSNSSTNMIYAENTDDTISVIDGATNTVTTTISVGTVGMFIAANPSNNKIYVTDGISTVSTIDGSTNTVASTTTVGTGAVAVAVNPSTNTIYTVNNTEGTVSVLNHLYQSGTISNLKINSGTGIKSSWTNISWTADAPANTTVKFRTRGASTEEGLATASWSDYYTSGGGSSITTSASQWLEAETTLESSDGLSTPTLSDFTVTYNTLNAPTVANLVQARADNDEVIPVSGWTNEGEIKLAVNNISGVSDNDTWYAQFELKKYNVEFDGQGLKNGTSTTVGGSSTVTANELDDNYATYHWRARLTDQAGRVSAWTEYAGGGDSFSVDYKAPTGTVSINNNAVKTGSSNVVLTISANDPGDSNVSKMRFSNDGTNWNDWENYATSKTWSLMSGDGTRTVYAQFKDNAGNTSPKWTTKDDFESNAATTGQATVRSNIRASELNPNSDTKISLTYSGTGDGKTVVTGPGFSFLIKSDGTLWAAGANGSGQLGLGDNDNRNSWTQTSLTSVVSVDTADEGDYSLALKSDGTLWAAGANGSGQLGLGDNDDRNSWIQTSSNVSSMTMGYNHSIILKNDGTLWGTGRNNSGQLGLADDSEDKNIWTQLTLTDVTDIDATMYGTTIALKSDGTVWVTGWRAGIIGFGTQSSFTSFTQSPISDVAKISSGGDNNTLAVKSDRSLWVAGKNGSVLGLGDNNTHYSWTDSGISSVIEASPSQSFSSLIKSDGSVWMTGTNSGGQLGLGDNENRSVWTKTSQANIQTSYHQSSNSSIAITYNGTVWVAGDNASGQLGLGDNDNRNTWTQSATGVKSPFTYLSPGTIGGTESSVGLRFDGSATQKWLSLAWNGAEVATGQAIKLAVKTSSDGVSWSGPYGRDGQAIDWSSNYFGKANGDSQAYTDLANIAAATRYLDIMVRLEGNPYAPIIYDVTLNSATFDDIVVDGSVTDPIFDPDKKYPASDWNVKENVNSLEFRFTTPEATVSYVDYGTVTADQEAGGDPKSSTEHYIMVKGLQANTAYNYKLRIIDEMNNARVVPASSFYSATTTSADTGFEGGPLVSSMSQVEITATSAKITWKSKVPTESWVDYGLTSEYGSTAGDNDLNTNHVVELKNLVAGQVYHYRVRGKDAGGNEYASSDYTFKAVMKPEVSNVKVKDFDSDSATITWTTNVKTDSGLNYGGGLPYTKREQSYDMLTTHEIKLTNLEDNAEYHYQIEVKDDYGNISKTQDMTFATPLDTIGPRIENVKIDVLPLGSDEQEAQIIVSWNTNKPSTAKVEYGEGVVGGKYDKSSIEDKSLNSSHTVIVKGLATATTYHFRIVSRDKRNNLTNSNDYNFVTSAKEKSIWQLILKSIEETFSWIKNMPNFFKSLGEKARK